MSDINNIIHFLQCLRESIESNRELLISADNILYPEQNMKNNFKVLCDAFVSHTTMNIINFRYIIKDDTAQVCNICQKKFENNDICRIPGINYIDEGEINTKTICECLFHAKCICDYSKINNTKKCPVCNLKIEDKI